MISLIITAVGVGLCLLLIPVYLTSRFNNTKLLFKELGLTYDVNGKTFYPKYKRSRNKLTFYKYSPAITSEDFGTKELKAFSKVFSKNEKDSFVLAEYEQANFFSRHLLGHNKNKLVLYSSKIKETDFFKNCRSDLQMYDFWIGKDLKNNDAIYSLYNKNSISIYGQMGLGKSSLANCILTSLGKSTEREIIFTKSKADYIKSHHTSFFQKDDEPKMLEILRELKFQAIKKQQELDDENLQNIFQKNDKLTVIVFDEAHSYLSSAPSSFTKEEKATRQEIISLASFLLKQCRSSGFIVIFLLPSADRSELELNTREVSYIFSTKIPSETVSKNIFNSPIASLIPAKPGLFVSNDDFQTRLIQVATIKRTTS